MAKTPQSLLGYHLPSFHESQNSAKKIAKIKIRRTKNSAKKSAKKSAKEKLKSNVAKKSALKSSENSAQKSVSKK